MGRHPIARTAGDLRRKENMRYLVHMVRIAMPGGISRAELVPKYAYIAGITEKKANEHLDLLITIKELEEADMRIYLFRGTES